MVRTSLKLGRGEKQPNGKWKNRVWYISVDTKKDKYLGKTNTGFLGVIEEYGHKMTPSEYNAAGSTKNVIYYSYKPKGKWQGFYYNGYFPPNNEDLI